MAETLIAMIRGHGLLAIGIIEGHSVTDLAVPPCLSDTRMGWSAVWIPLRLRLVARCLTHGT